MDPRTPAIADDATRTLAGPMRFGAPAGPLSGTVAVPGDKSISHRAIILGALAVGRTTVRNLLEGEDVAATAAAMRAMGATVTRHASGQWHIDGVGTGTLLQPHGALDMGNSGTSARLLMGLVATHPITATFTGDASLSRRPMARVVAPLSQMGASFHTSPGERLPLMVRGACPAVPITHRLTVPSAQVKTAILLAALNTPGTTTVIEPVPTRDHGERMLAAFGAAIAITQDTDGARVIALDGPARLLPQTIAVPGDPSSAAFLIVAALVVPGSFITITGVGVNPTRDGLMVALRAMGADISVTQTGTMGGEPVADILVRHGPLLGAVIDPDLAPSMIDEYPALFVAAAFASGRTEARGIRELRVKESDRLAVMAMALRAAGARVEELDDGLVIDGTGGLALAGGAAIAGHLDHRICMAMAVCGLGCAAPVRIDDMAPVATSFPTFLSVMERLGAGPCR